MKTLRCLLIIGTRPETIKMAPVVRACSHERVESILCSTGQHRELLVDLLEYFDLSPQISLDLMQADQGPGSIAARCLEELDGVISRTAPDCVVGQGDTATVMAAAAAAFFRRVPFVHVEAGLRTGQLDSPWPEEFNRRVVTLATSLHCAPTPRAAENLFAEGVDASTVHVTGNTVVDALHWTVDREGGRESFWRNKYPQLDGRRVVLITGHRRENFGERFEAIFRGINALADAFPGAAFVYPVHLNPNVHQPAREFLGDRKNIHLIEPVGYAEFVWLLGRADLLISDSGGVQEEATALKKHVLVTREVTERQEAVEAGAVELVGSSTERLVDRGTALLQGAMQGAEKAIGANPYGDGHAAERIVDLMLERFTR
jgi:UDP-N-acetylglucosamine 2-epimerase